MLQQQNNNLSKTLGFLALGVGLSVATMYAAGKLTTKSGSKKVPDTLKLSKSKAKSDYLEKNLEGKLWEKEEMFEKNKQVNLANMMLKKSGKVVKGKGGRD